MESSNASISSGSETSALSATAASAGLSLMESSNASISSGSETSALSVTGACAGISSSSDASNKALISSASLITSPEDAESLSDISLSKLSNSFWPTTSLSSASDVSMSLFESSSSMMRSSSKPANRESRSLWSSCPPSKASPSSLSSSNAIASRSSSKEISSRSSKSSRSSSWIDSSSSNSSSSESKSSPNKSSCSSSFSDKSIDNSSSSESSLSSVKSSSSDISLSKLSGASFSISTILASGSTSLVSLVLTTFTSSSLLERRRNKIANSASTIIAGKVAIKTINQVLDIKLPSSRSAFCFSSSKDCSRASAFANNACCRAIISSICTLISLLFATSFCMVPSWSLKLVRRSRNVSFSFNKLCKPSIESKTSFWIVAKRCCCVSSMAFNWTLISDFAASKSFLLTEASSGGITFFATTLTTFFCQALSSLRDFCCALLVLIALITSIGGIFKYWPLIMWFKLLSLKEPGLFSYSACMTW